MKPSEVAELKLRAPVWVWVVRFGNGRWWPGVVEDIEITKGLPLIEVRFESFSRARRRTSQPVALGLIKAPMRRLERRDGGANGADRPRFVPVSRLRSPEMPVHASGPHLLEASVTIFGLGGPNGLHSSSIGGGSYGTETVPALLGKA